MEKRVLLTGASGYVGGRLLPRLEKRGLVVRCLARRPEFLEDRVGASTEVVEGDVLRAETLQGALEGVHTAYYMVHSMGSASREGFEAQDRSGARNFARAARAAGVRRIIYLGGWETRSRSSRRICEAVTRWDAHCAHRACRSSSSAPRS